MKNKIRLDLLLVSKGLAETRSKAQAIIIAGQVEAGGQTLLKPGTSVDSQSQITLKKTNPFVSRGGLKLDSAIETLKIHVTGKICMDIGASTGGFTDCMLQRGAVKVYAVDVGRNQLHEKLKKDPRVINIERMNFRYFPGEFPGGIREEFLKDPVEFVTIDVSFISLEKILPAAVEASSGNAEILAMVKPQFEATPKELKKGVVRDEKIRLRTIEKIKAFASTLNLSLKGEVDSSVRGPEGNLEHFLWLVKEGR
ncbi:MAG: TlyA family RNA methyltransferase [Elusimicrobiota bacterium]